MAYENIFLGSIEYSNQLQAEERRGRLQAETVSADTRAAMIEEVATRVRAPMATRPFGYLIFVE